MYQFNWNRELREHIYDSYNFNDKRKILEIGCGTCVLLGELGQRLPLSKEADFELVGIDNDSKRLKIAKKYLNSQNIKAKILNMDAYELKFKDDYFDAIFTHLALLWIHDLERIFNEIKRVLRKGGIFVIFAEPDYGGLIEYPDCGLREAIIDNLRSEGADPLIGRKLPSYFRGFNVIGRYCGSVPWLSSLNYKDMLGELEFFKNLLGTDAFNYRKMKVSIDAEFYTLFIPIFTFILEKI